MDIFSLWKEQLSCFLLEQHFYPWWKLSSVVFHWVDSVLRGTQGQLSWLKLGIGNYTLQVFLPKAKIKMNFLMSSTDAGGAYVAVSSFASIGCVFIGCLSSKFWCLRHSQLRTCTGSWWKLSHFVLLENYLSWDPLFAWFLDLGYDSVHGTLRLLLSFLIYWHKNRNRIPSLHFFVKYSTWTC